MLGVPSTKLFKNRQLLALASKKYLNGQHRKQEYKRFQELRATKLAAEEQAAKKAQHKAQHTRTDFLAAQKNFAESKLTAPIPFNHRPEQKVDTHTIAGRIGSPVRALMLIAATVCLFSTPHVLPIAEAREFKRDKNKTRKSESSTHAKQEPVKQEFDVEVPVATARGTVNNPKTAAAQPQQKDATPVSAQELKELKNSMRKHVTLLRYRGDNSISLEEYKDDVLLNKAIRALAASAKTNRATYCKLSAILERKDFEMVVQPHAAFIVLVKPHIPGRQFSPTGSGAMFVAAQNRIYFSINSILKAAFFQSFSTEPDNVFPHEFHHAWIAYRNTKKFPGSPISSSACKLAPPTHKKNCKELKKIIKDGIARMNQLLDDIKLNRVALIQLSRSGRPLETVALEKTTKNPQQLKDYIHVATKYKYKPLLISYTMSGEEAKSLFDEWNKQMKKKEAKEKTPLAWTFKDSPVPGANKLFIYDVKEEKEGVAVSYIVTAHLDSFSSQNLHDYNRIGRVLVDLLDFFVPVYESLSRPNYYTEIDASAVGLYNNYPELFNFLFPGLREYHLEKGGEEYKQCMQPTPHLSR